MNLVVAGTTLFTGTPANRPPLPAPSTSTTPTRSAASRSRAPAQRDRGRHRRRRARSPTSRSRAPPAAWTSTPRPVRGISADLDRHTTGGIAVNLNNAGTVNFTAAGTISLTLGRRARAHRGTRAGTALSGTVDSVTTTSSPTTGISLTNTTGVAHARRHQPHHHGHRAHAQQRQQRHGQQQRRRRRHRHRPRDRPDQRPHHAAGRARCRARPGSSSGGTDGINIDGIGAGTFTAAGGTISGHSAAELDINGGTGNVTYPGTIDNGTGLSVADHRPQRRHRRAHRQHQRHQRRRRRHRHVTGNTGGTSTSPAPPRRSTPAPAPPSPHTRSAPRSTSPAAASTSTPPPAPASTPPAAAPSPSHGTNNTIDTTTGTALNVTNTDIGASGLTFQSISANGAPNGIVLNNTGASGGLTVAANGGRARQQRHAPAARSRTPRARCRSRTHDDVAIDRMFIQNTVNDGIEGTSTTNFSFTNGRIDNSGTGLGPETSNIGFNTTAAATENNLVRRRHDHRERAHQRVLPRHRHLQLQRDDLQRDPLEQHDHEQHGARRPHRAAASGSSGLDRPRPSPASPRRR